MSVRTLTVLSALLTAFAAGDARAADTPDCWSAGADLAATLQAEDAASDWQVWTVELAASTPKYSNITLKRGYVGRTMELWAEVAEASTSALCGGLDDLDTDSDGVAGAKSEDAFFVRCDRSTTTGRRVEMYIAWDATAGRGEAVGCAVLDEAQAMSLLDSYGGTVTLTGVEPDEID